MGDIKEHEIEIRTHVFMETEAILRIPTRNINLKYHHLGIPTKNKLKDERHLKHLKMYVSGHGENPYGVE